MLQFVVARAKKNYSPAQNLPRFFAYMNRGRCCHPTSGPDRNWRITVGAAIVSRNRYAGFDSGRKFWRAVMNGRQQLGLGRVSAAAGTFLRGYANLLQTYPSNSRGCRIVDDNPWDEESRSPTRCRESILHSRTVNPRAAAVQNVSPAE